MAEKPEHAVSAHEVAAVLRRAAAGKLEIRLADERRPWEEEVVCEFVIGDWVIAFFNDDGEVDYTEYAQAPDGRCGHYEGWADEMGGEADCPLALLSAEERQALEQKIAGCKWGKWGNQIFP